MAAPLNNRGAVVGTQVRQRKAHLRADKLRAYMMLGEPFKRAAWYAGVSLRTARRYRRRWSAQ